MKRYKYSQNKIASNAYHLKASLRAVPSEFDGSTSRPAIRQILKMNAVYRFDNCNAEFVANRKLFETASRSSLNQNRTKASREWELLPADLLLRTSNEHLLVELAKARVALCTTYRYSSV